MLGSLHNAVCFEQTDPRRWTRKVNDQSIVIGWAGYDDKVGYLPPEHWLAHQFRIAIEMAIDPIWREDHVWRGCPHPRSGELNLPTLRPAPLDVRLPDSISLEHEGPDGKLLVRIREVR